MQILLLSGGSGKRLWPLSNNSRSKQFIKLLNSPDGQKESMVQRVIRQLGESDLKGHVTVATSLSQADVIYNQLGEYIDVVVEPERRDTFPAIALAASYLKYEKSCADEEVVVVMPCDPFTEAGYIKVFNMMGHCMFQKRIRQGSLVVPFTNLSGMYILQIHSANYQKYYIVFLP